MPGVRFNTEECTHVDDTSFSLALNIYSNTQLDHETLERRYGNNNLTKK